MSLGAEEEDLKPSGRGAQPGKAPLKMTPCRAYPSEGSQSQEKVTCGSAQEDSDNARQSGKAGTCCRTDCRITLRGDSIHPSLLGRWGRCEMLNIKFGGSASDCLKKGEVSY